MKHLYQVKKRKQKITDFRKNNYTDWEVFSEVYVEAGIQECTFSKINFKRLWKPLLAWSYCKIITECEWGVNKFINKD